MCGALEFAQDKNLQLDEGENGVKTHPEAAVVAG